jgi:pyruvate dehydrogenase E1 component
VYSVTSLSELARDAREVERWNRTHADAPSRTSHLERTLAGPGPVVAASDYVRAYAQLIASYVDRRFVALGTDGFGRSDTRAALRRFFEVDRHHVVLATLGALVAEGMLPREVLGHACARYDVDPQRPAPWST